MSLEPIVVQPVVQPVVQEGQLVVQPVEPEVVQPKLRLRIDSIDNYWKELAKRSGRSTQEEHVDLVIKMARAKIEAKRQKRGKYRTTLYLYGEFKLSRAEITMLAQRINPVTVDDCTYCDGPQYLTFSWGPRNSKIYNIECRII